MSTLNPDPKVSDETAKAILCLARGMGHTRAALGLKRTGVFYVCRTPGQVGVFQPQAPEGVTVIPLDDFRHRALGSQNAVVFDNSAIEEIATDLLNERRANREAQEEITQLREIVRVYRKNAGEVSRAS